jgi:hypothetical protein
LNKAKYRAAMLLCQERGWTFQVMTEEQIRPGFLQTNLKKLLEVKCHKVTPAVAEFIRTTLSYEGPTNIQDLRKQCSIVDPSLFMLNLHKLIYDYQIYTDLIRSKLNDKSIVWVKE